MGGPAGIWAHEWDSLGEAPWQGGARSRRVGRGGQMGVTLYELPPGATGGMYHFHHGSEEILVVVLRGAPALRTPAGERALAEGEVVVFAVGPEGAHQVVNRGDGPVRYLMVSTRPSPEVVEYPDTGQVSFMALDPLPDRRAAVQRAQPGRGRLMLTPGGS